MEVRTTFETWWNENKDSEALYDRYLECCFNSKSTGQISPSYKQWVRKYFKHIDEPCIPVEDIGTSLKDSARAVGALLRDGDSEDA